MGKSVHGVPRGNKDHRRPSAGTGPPASSISRPPPTHWDISWLLPIPWVSTAACAFSTPTPYYQSLTYLLNRLGHTMGNFFSDAGKAAFFPQILRSYICSFLHMDGIICKKIYHVPVGLLWFQPGQHWSTLYVLLGNCYDSRTTCTNYLN